MMPSKDKREFGKWWIWVLALIVITGAVGFGMRFAGVAGDRIIFENSYQKAAADADRTATLEAELAQINALLRSNTLTEIERADLEAQRAAITVQLERQN